MYREWSTVWQGQPIVVKVWYRNDWVFRLTEELWIADLLVDRNTCRDVMICERLAAPFSIGDRVHHVEIAISYGNSKPCCNIYVDGEIIGGDIDFKIPRTDLTIWPEMRRRGFCHFFGEAANFQMLRLVRAFAPAIFLFPAMSVLLHFMGRVPFSWEHTLLFLFQCVAIVIPGVILGGLAITFFHWRMLPKIYAQTLAHQRKLDVLPLRLGLCKQSDSTRTNMYTDRFE